LAKSSFAALSALLPNSIASSQLVSTSEEIEKNSSLGVYPSQYSHKSNGLGALPPKSKQIEQLYVKWTLVSFKMQEIRIE